MGRNASGTYSLPEADVVAGTTITASWANSQLNDIAAALTDSLSRSGDGGMQVSFEFTDGTVSAPGITWSNETATGIYRAGTADMRFAVGANDKARITSSATNPFEVYIDATWTAVTTAAADETISGDWTVSGAWTISGEWNFNATARHFGVDSIYRDGGAVQWYDASDTDRAKLSVGSNALDLSNPEGSITKFNLRDGIILSVRDSTDVDMLEMSHDGTDGKIECSTDLSVEPDVYTQFVGTSNQDIVRVLGTTSAAPGGTQNGFVSFRNSSDTRVGYVGFPNSVNLTLFSANDGGSVNLGGTKTGGASTATIFTGSPDGQAAVYFDGAQALRTVLYTDSGNGTSGEVRDGEGSWQPIGMNVAPLRAMDTNDTLDLTMGGQYLHKTAAGATALTLDNDATIPVGATSLLCNEGAGAATLTEGTGVTLKWFDGSAVQTGNRTVGQGGVVTIYKKSATEYHVFGSGIA